MSRSAWAIGIVIASVLILLVGAGLIASGSWGRGYGWGMTLAPALRFGASPGVGPGMMGPGMTGGWWGFSFLGPIFGLVLVGLIIGGVVWFVLSLSRKESRLGSGPTARETPLEILKRRYASGEVTKKQFEDMRRTLNL